MKIKIKYFIGYIGDRQYYVWCEEKHNFIPSGMHLYRTTYDDLDEAYKAIKQIRAENPKHVDRIMLDSFVAA